MRTSRRLEDLIPPVRARALDFLAAAQAEGIELIVTCTLRDAQAQDALYAIGRSLPGRKVTHARGGDSFHQYGVALDVVPLRAGKPVWGTRGADLALWQRVGELGEAAGLEWAGRWARFAEFPHFQQRFGYSLADFKAGALGRLATVS